MKAQVYKSSSNIHYAASAAKIRILSESRWTITIHTIAGLKLSGILHDSLSDVRYKGQYRFSIEPPPAPGSQMLS